MTARFGSALSALDQAIERVRSEPLAQSFACALPALALTWLALFAYYLEQVEGVRALRPAFAAAMTLGWCARALVLMRCAHHATARELGPLAALGESAADTRLRVALSVGVELGAWLSAIAAATQLDPWLGIAALPLLAVRGALWPVWLAAGASAKAGRARSAAWHALSAGRGQRALGAALELLLLLSALALFLNLAALSVALVSLAQDLLGLRLSFVRAFISPRNHFAVMALSGISLAALEPLRAALSGVLYAAQRREHEAVEVRALVQAALRADTYTEPPRRTGLAAIGLALTLALSASGARADDQSSESGFSAQAEPECDERCREARKRDDEVLVTLVSILDQAEFRDFAEPSARGDHVRVPSFTDWLERLGRFLTGPHDERERGSALSRIEPIHLPLGWLLAGLGALLSGLVAAVLARGRTRVPRRATPEQSTEPSAAALAAFDVPDDGSARATLRRCYVAALRSLAERGLLRLSPHDTCGHYLRAVRGAPEHAFLARLTQLFERTWYGQAEPSARELDEARALAERLQRGALS